MCLADVTDQELQALLSQKDLATSFAEDLLKQFGSEDLVDIKESKILENIDSNTASSSSYATNTKSPSVKCEVTSTSLTNNMLSKYDDTVKPVIKIENLFHNDIKPIFTTDMVSKDILLAVKYVYSVI